MIRARLDKDGGGSIVLLGLGPTNLERLQKGEPIRVNLRQLDPSGPVEDDQPDIKIAIAFDDGSLVSQLVDLSRRRQR